MNNSIKHSIGKQTMAARLRCWFPNHLSIINKLYLNIDSNVPLRDQEHYSTDHDGHVK
ncbi:MAG: hypothetical protein ACJZ8R_07430 [Pseudohongiellaceae bacterium]